LAERLPSSAIRVSAHSKSPAIEVSGLTKRYGATTAVENLSFTASHGRITGFLGPNGAGKTTTLRALLGLITPTSGMVGIDGRSYAEIADPARTVGASLDSRFHPGRSGRGHLRALAIAAGVARSRVEDLLTAVDLQPAGNRPVGTYSLGMRQRLGLAAALLGDPQILILDEPANGLDPQGIRWLRDLLRSLAGEGRAILMSSHVLAEVARTVDDVVIISKGRSMLQAPLHTVMAERADVRVEGPDAAKLGVLLSAEGAVVTNEPMGAIVVRGRTREQIGTTIAANQLVITELAPTGSSLEEIFLEITGTQDGD
jgi:ABC-2 type transport system ATP-binding protein